jgi:hypothetical protein
MDSAVMRVSIMNDVWYNSISLTVARSAFQSLNQGSEARSFAFLTPSHRKTEEKYAH